ncbi:N-terminal nucleophile aminohydrolase [Trichoderma citrinoviride]|uniref:N-terminal nucleophile aminohydrolase n=1 Tax=Trichoderma citrinoviride TaxID=58853 RepID=A0A2T4B8E8_9HYPO|nr:N-terminal nucleophile aminohydrolase [Trichoderma citrinoviride]PTB65607.1 N-terminal nucleophile aminohydrolase [Trichoderma citrinoviride]
MEYRKQRVSEDGVSIQPRLIIHGGAGNILRSNFPAEKYAAYRSALLSIVIKTQAFMNSSTPTPSTASPYMYTEEKKQTAHPSALEIATHAVVLLEDNPLFNSGHGAVFTRDGVNELEASVMVSRGLKKRGVGVMGLRRVRNPILLAKKMLEHGEDDLAPAGSNGKDVELDVPSAQGHTQLHGPTAEKLAAKYNLPLVDPSYFFTQQRWDEHVRALEREKSSGLSSSSSSATWHADEYLPQGTCGAVALDAEGVICAATSTGGMTNKLTGRIGDTPVVGAGFWAEEWDEEEDVEADALLKAEPGISFAGPLKGLLADCFPTPWMYSPSFAPPTPTTTTTTTTRSVGFSGTGNGDSFLRVNAVRTVAAIARYKPSPARLALARVAGPGGQLQQSAGDRWGRTGEGEGGMIGLECVLERDEDGRVVGARSEVLMGYNCGGMYRAWIDDEGRPVMSIWSNGSADEL